MNSRRFGVTIHLPHADLHIDHERQSLRVISLDGLGLPVGTVEEMPLAKAIDILTQARASSVSIVPDTGTQEGKG